MGKCVIIGGADITSYDRIRTYLSEDDFCIYCDSGLKHRKMLGKDPDLIVGDFDSCTEYDIQIKHRSEEQIKNFDLSNYMDGDPDHFPLSYEPAKEAPAIRITPEKYDSDTMFGVREGLKRGLDEFLLAGAIGQRFDHSFANISILLMLDMEGIAVSTGSACATGSLEPSYVLMAGGLDEEHAHGSVRFSFGRFNSMEEVDRVLEVLPPVIEKLRAISTRR